VRGLVIALSLVLVFTGVPECRAERPDGKPDYDELTALNSLLPGIGLSRLGLEEEAKWYYAALPLSLAGTGLAVTGVFLFSNSVRFDAERRDGETYLVRYDRELGALSNILVYGGVVLGLYGNLLTTYSGYALHREYVDRYGDPYGGETVTTGRLTLPEVIAAPFLPSVVFSVDVLPVLGLSTAAGFSVSDYRRMGDFFTRESVPFMGFAVHPVAGLGLQILSGLLLVTANSAWEEIAFRGLQLETRGTVYSSFSFGLAHLTNMLVPGASVESTMLQTLFATAFGFYAAERTLDHGYDFRRMVALHFWHNLLSLVLGYLAEPEETGVFTIRYRF
jgi:hypothetical protein